METNGGMSDDSGSTYDRNLYYQAKKANSELLSWLDMKPFAASDLVRIIGDIHAAYDDNLLGNAKEYRQRISWTCVRLKAFCEFADCSSDLLNQIDQVGRMANSDVEPADRDHNHALFVMSLYMIENVVNALDRPRFKMIPDNRLKYFDSPRVIFGESVVSKFPSAEYDIEEAGKCYAVGRETAAVFHLMRVMEVGLRSLALTLKDERLDPKRNPSWESILKKCDEELAKPLKDRSVEWRADEAFYSTATANLRAVKDAWRNPTMHVERTYNEDTALEVWNAVQAFMRHLSIKLNSRNG